jgi:hypothetical protein
MGEFDQVYKEKEEPEFIYPIYDIEYTNIQGKRAKAEACAKTTEHAFGMLEDLLKKAGYWSSSIKNLNPIFKEQEGNGCEFGVNLL